MFYVIDLERRWRIENGLQPGFTTLDNCKPVVAVGATNPIEGAILEYDYFRNSPTPRIRRSNLT